MIDSHAHLISDDHDRYRPAPISGALRPHDLDDPMTAERLLREMDKGGVERAVLVQRGQVYGYDSSYICDSVDRYPDRFAAVVAIDGLAADAADQVRRWVDGRGAAGVRVMEPARGADPGWFANPAVWETVADLGVPLCIHVFAWARADVLPTAIAMADRYPTVKLVFDHFTNMAGDSGPPDHGVDELMVALAARPQVNMKFTTLPLGPLEARGVDTARVVDRVAALFAPDRLMWGSDIGQSKGSYAEMLAMGRRAVEGQGARARQQMLGGVAGRLYGGGPASGPA